MMRQRQAFTLLEALIVAIIVGILSTLGFVNYRGIREQSLGKEARANLKLIAAAERIYRMEWGSYAGPTGDLVTINSVLKLSLDSNRWTYNISAATRDTFTATADRVGGGGNLDCLYTINQTTTNEPTRNASCP